MITENTTPKSIFARLLDGAADMIKRPFVEKRVKRAFETAGDSIEEQLMDNEAQLNSARESFVNAAKSEGNLKSYIQTLVDLQTSKTTLEAAKSALAAEKKAFLEV